MSPRGALDGWAFYALHVGGSLCVGGFIYLAFRTEGLLMFDWVESLGGLPGLRAVRGVTLPVGEHLPGWVLFSVPDGAWVYACTAFFARLWRDEPGWQGLAWASVGAVLAMGSELMQHPAIGLVPGTFDPVDCLLYGAAAAVALGFAWRGRSRPEP